MNSKRPPINSIWKVLSVKSKLMLELFMIFHAKVFEVGRCLIESSWFVFLMGPLEDAYQSLTLPLHFPGCGGVITSAHLWYNSRRSPLILFCPCTTLLSDGSEEMVPSCNLATGSLLGGTVLFALTKKSSMYPALWDPVWNFPCILWSMWCVAI